MFKILGRIGKQWWLLLLLMLTIAATALTDFALPIQLGNVIKTLQASRELPNPTLSVLLECVGMLMIAALSGILSILTCRMAARITARCVSVTRYELFKRVSTFSTTEMNRFSVSSLVTRTTNDLTFVANTLNPFLRYTLYGPLLSVMALVGLVAMGKVEMMTAIAIAVGLILILIFITVKIVLPRYEAIQAKLDKVALVTRENLDGLRVVRAYNAEDYQEKKFAAINEELMKTEKFSNSGLGILTPAIGLIVGVLNVAIYFIGAKLIGGGAKDFAYADISIVTQFAALILIGFIMLITVIVMLPRTIICAKRVNEVIDTVPAVQSAAQTPAVREKGTIEFRNVSFSYPGAEHPVVDNISFKVKQGETIAFIGATGSGKSTVLNLMLRFFDATKGEVLIDGVNVKEYRLEDLYHRFGYVPQRGYMFHDSLVNNITIGKPDATPVQIDRALEISQSREFVDKLPGGIEYEISQGGKNVSGGQRQRLCIARAIIMDPEIFVFDDSFSALDYRTDKILRGEIKKQCTGVTNVIVAQRVGTILEADQIVCLDGGKVMGIGTHRQLLETCPVYREIALSQLSAEELGIKEGK